jgi:hypothetical protein
MENIMPRAWGVSKYGFKLEDFDSKEDFKKACRNATVNAYNKSSKGKLTFIEHRKSEKYKLSKAKTDAKIC